MTSPAVLILDRIGGAYTSASLLSGGLGGSEIEVLQVARGLTAKGHAVVVANGVDRLSVEDGVTYVPHAQAWQHTPTKALYLQRFSAPETRLEIPKDVRVVVRANDQYCPPYDVHRASLTSGRSTLVANTKWQAAQFAFAKDTAIIPPMLEPVLPVEKQSGLFVFASGALKGFDATVKLWCSMKRRHPAMATTRLAIVCPGWGPPPDTVGAHAEHGIFYVGNPTPDEYRQWIAKAEGLFTVLTMPETFCCVAALAERAGTRTHILCQAGFGGLTEAVRDHYFLTEDPSAFEASFIEALAPRGPIPVNVPASYVDLRPSILIDRWAEVLHVDQPAIVVTTPTKRLPARADGRPTVGLCLIAKGEEVSTVVTRAIHSAKKAGVDCLTVVCDADDATADLARTLGADVYIRPSPKIDWEHGDGIIAGARNEALAIAEARTDYVLVLDADDHFAGALPSTLDHDAYEVTIQDGGLTYQRVQLFRSGLGARYHGIIHEVLQFGASGPVGRLTTLSYKRGRSTYSYQDQDPPAVKFSKHAHLARKWLLDHPDDARMQFYFARSLHDAGRFEEALVAYEHRITMLNGWEEERAYSAYQIGLMLSEQGKDPTLALIRAHGLGTPSAEPLVALARWYRDDSRRQFSIAYALATRASQIPQPETGLFVQPWIYRFEAAAEVAICAYWLGNKREALDRFDRLLPTLPEERRAWGESQIAICRRDLGQ